MHEIAPIEVRAAVSRRFAAPLSLEKVSLRAPGIREIRVRIDAVAICQSDLAFIDNHWGADLPAIWGHEAAGTVLDTGPHARVSPDTRVVVTLIRSCGQCAACRCGLVVGCRAKPTGSPALHDMQGSVITQGMDTAAFADTVLVHDSQVVPIPDAVASDVASLLACGAITGFGAVVNTAALPAGTASVVIGTGGVGLHAVQGARVQRSDPIIAIDTDDERLAVARRVGATHTVNPAHENPVEAVAEATNGDMADTVFVTTGAQAALESAHALVAAAGTLVLVGMPANGVTLPLDAGTLASLNQRVLGSKMGTSIPGRDIPRLFELYSRGDLFLDELVTRRYPFDQVNDAIDDSRRGTGIRNVVVFDPQTTEVSEP